MAYEEVSRVEVNEIIRQWQAGGSIRGIARRTGLARSTVQRYVHAAQRRGLLQDGSAPTEEQLTALVGTGVAGPRRVVRPTEEVLAPWADQIQRWVQQDRLRLTRVQELLVKQGCLIPYQAVQEAFS